MRNYNCDLIGEVVSVEENPDRIDFILSVNRSNNRKDILPLYVNRDLIDSLEVTLMPGIVVEVLGVIRTIRLPKSQRAILRIESTSISRLGLEERHKNRVFGRFNIKETKVKRKTSNGHYVKDIVLHRMMPSGESEFRALLWDKDADKYENIENNSELFIVGEIHSREYSKKSYEGFKRIKTYEVTIGCVENDTDFYGEEMK